jgi:hypothetical protein
VHEADIFDIFQDHKKTMWYSTNEGLLRGDNEPLARLRPLGPATTAAYRTYEDRQGFLWVVLGTGVFRITGDLIEDTPVPNVHPRCFHADREMGFWVGTNGNGLIHLRHRVVRMFTRADGLISNIPMAVLSSHEGTRAAEKPDTHALPDRPSLDAGTESVDPSDDFMPRNARPSDRKESVHRGRVRVADPTCLHANAYMIGTGIEKRLPYFREFSRFREFDCSVCCAHNFPRVRLPR